jgi:hypothetical protein
MIENALAADPGFRRQQAYFEVCSELRRYLEELPQIETP